MPELAVDLYEPTLGTRVNELTPFERLFNQTAEVARRFTDVEGDLPEESEAPPAPPGHDEISSRDWEKNYAEPQAPMDVSPSDGAPPDASSAEPASPAPSEGLSYDKLRHSESEDVEVDELTRREREEFEEAIRRSEHDPDDLDIEEAIRRSQQNPHDLELEEAMHLSLDQAVFEEDRARASWLEPCDLADKQPAADKSPRSDMSAPRSDDGTVCVEDRDTLGQALFEAVEAEEYDKVERLLDFPGTPINWRGFNGRTPLLAACVKGNQRITALLIANGADVNQANDAHVAPLHVAAAGGFADCLRELLKAGASRRTKDSKGMTALQWARNSGHRAASKLLSGDFSHSLVNLRHGTGSAVVVRA